MGAASDAVVVRAPKQMDVVDPRIEGYMRTLLTRYDEPTLLEMETYAAERNFPIVDRLVGVTLELHARSIGARRVFELGSGFGYSAYWFARAVGSGGEVHCTDGDPRNEPRAIEYLSRAGLADPLRWHVGDALRSFAGVDGEFDVVFSDIDKHEYPDAWRAVRDRIRVGGLYLCDNTLSYGGGSVLTDGEWPAAIREHNALIAEDDHYVSVINPTRQGVLVAMRTT
jgi:caffeoyl-CoA O-methyltransferase